MKVETTYFADGDTDGSSFYNDIFVGLVRATALGDNRGGDVLWDLWLVHLEEDLGRMSPKQLERYIQTRQKWRWFGPDPVLKTVDTPCVAYTLYRTADALTVVGLGACYEYPSGGEDAWWRDVILPRLRKL